MMPRHIQTERLILRPYEPNDVDAIHEYAKIPEWGRFLPTPKPYLKEHAEEFVSRTIDQDWDIHPAWCVEYRGRGIGGVNIRFSFGSRVAEIGYSIAKAHWRNGFAFESTRALVNVAFEKLEQLNRIQAQADSRNTPSLPMQRRLAQALEKPAVVAISSFSIAGSLGQWRTTIPMMM